MPSSRAVARAQFRAGPSSGSAPAWIASGSPSTFHFSGSTTSSAPAAAARRVSASARSRLASLSWVEVSWTVATRMAVRSPVSRPEAGCPGAQLDERLTGQSERIPWRGPGPSRPDHLPLPPGPMPLLRGGRPLKRWRYVGVYDAAMQLCAGIVRVGPLAQTFWAVWDPEAQRLRERTRLLRPGAVRIDAARLRVRDAGVVVDLALDRGAPVEVVSPTAPSTSGPASRAAYAPSASCDSGSRSGVSTPAPSSTSRPGTTRARPHGSGAPAWAQRSTAGRWRGTSSTASTTAPRPPSGRSGSTGCRASCRRSGSPPGWTRSAGLAARRFGSSNSPSAATTTTCSSSARPTASPSAASPGPSPAASSWPRAGASWNATTPCGDQPNVVARPPPAAAAGSTALTLRSRDRSLELGLAHLRAALDVQPPGLGLELLARGLIAPAHRAGLLAERRPRALGQVLERLLAARALLRALDVAPRRGALLRSSHGTAATRQRWTRTA